MVEFTAKGSGYYRVMLPDGTEISKHTTEREALESLVNTAKDYPNAYVDHDYQVDVDLGDDECVPEPPIPEPLPSDIPPPVITSAEAFEDRIEVSHTHEVDYDNVEYAIKTRVHVGDEVSPFSNEVLVMGIGENVGENTGSNTGSSGAPPQQEEGSGDFGRVLYETFDNFGGWPTSAGIRNFRTTFPALVVSSSHDGRSGGGPRTSGAMAEVNINTAHPSGDDYASILWEEGGYATEYFHRFWLRADEDFETSNGIKWMRHSYQGDWGFPGVTVNTISMNPSPNFNISFNATGGITNAGMRPNPLYDHDWHKFEIYTHATNGVYRAWIDRDEPGGYGQFCNLTGQSMNKNWCPFIIPSNPVTGQSGYNLTGDNHIYIDSVEIYSTNGTGGTGSMADGTAGQS